MSWSGQIDETLGISKKQLADFDEFCAISHPEDREILMNTIRQCLVQDKTLDIEYRVSWPDKSIHWIHLLGELINDESGSPVRMSGVLSDVTAQKKLRLAPRRKIKQVA
jgi:PAS domain S-box-containing protein